MLPAYLNMKEPILHIFNPDTDYALAAGNLIYTPSAKLKRVRANFALLPALWAEHGDFILLLDNDAGASHSPKWGNIIDRKQINLLAFDDLVSYAHSFSSIWPWGWNFTLIESLKGKGVQPSILPSSQALEAYRNLSHRKTCIAFRNLLHRYLPALPMPPVQELKSKKEVYRFLSENPEAVFKAPWSSSGRGVIFSKNFTRSLLDEWTLGTIRKQGSIMGEPHFNRILDFATEWECENGKASYIGLSVFETSSRGKYKHNINASQSELYDLISKNSMLWGENIILAQKMAIENLIASQYTGPVGIDMLIDANHIINPCVEINLRMTMGRAAIHARENGLLIENL